MTLHGEASESSLRVLVLAPVGRDAEVLEQALGAAGMVAETCSSVPALCRLIEEGAGAAVVADEALSGRAQRELEHVLSRQPEWSDFPLIVMTTRRSERRSGWSFVGGDAVSYAVILERPVYGETLLSAVRSALRSRTRQYQVREQLVERARAEEQLREADRRKDEFLAVLAHELRNPLAAIRNATDLMRLSAPESGQLQQVHGVLERQSAHMNRLIDGLLEVSRISRGKIHLERESVDVGKVIREVLHDRMAEIEGRGLDLKADVPSEALWVWGDRVRLAQVLDNLVGNAIKFTSAPGRITVTLEEEEGRAVLRVRDTGAGIRPEKIASMFEPFQQDTEGSGGASGGLGLGLALSKGLVELHGGSVHAHSAGPGMGSEFEVRLPLTAAAAEEQPAEESVEVTPRRILLVEDNVDAGQTLRELMETYGHEVTLVETGAEALDVLYRRGADVVFCDLGLPDMSGYEVSQAVRADPSLRGTVLVALTGYGQPEDRTQSNEAGFDEHVTKPADIQDLQTVLGRVSS